MSEEATGGSVCGWVRVVHPSGLTVTLPVPVKGERFDYRGALAGVGDALAAGWLTAAPGLEAGEEKEEVGYVLLRTKVNQDKSETKVIDLYSSGTGLKFKLVSVYLDDADDVAGFEAASGMRVSALKEFPGSTSPKRGDNPKSDAFIVKVPKPFDIVLAPNPKYNPDETDPAKKKPERVFVRWTTGQTAPTLPNNSTNAEFLALLAGITAAKDQGQLGVAWNAVNAAVKAKRLSDDECDRLVRAKDTKKAVLADQVAGPGEDDDFVPF